MSDDLARIFIRARVNDRWESLSLRELLDSGNGGQIGRWFYSRCGDAVGLEEGAVVTEAHALAIVEFLEKFRPVVRLNEVAP